MNRFKEIDKEEQERKGDNSQGENRIEVFATGSGEVFCNHETSFRSALPALSSQMEPFRGFPRCEECREPRQTDPNP